MFLDNKYRHWHDAIIERARGRGTIDEYTENHHIIPKSMGGNNTKDNLVRLTYREHYLIHWLLVKFVEDCFKSKMMLAFGRMAYFQVKYAKPIASWRVVKAKQASRLIYDSFEFRDARRQYRLGKKATPEERSRLSVLRKGKKMPPWFAEQARQRMLGNTWMIGKKHSDETKRKMSAQRMGNKHSLGHKHTAEFREQKRLNWLGRNHTEKSRALMSVRAFEREAKHRQRRLEQQNAAAYTTNKDG